MAVSLKPTFHWATPASRTTGIGPRQSSHYDRAIALNREAVNNHSYYPFYLTVGGRFEEAIGVARRNVDRDPVSAALSHTLAVQLVPGQASRRMDRGMAQDDRTRSQLRRGL